MDIKEAIVNIERCLIYWNAGASKNVDKIALELLLAYTKEALKASHNTASTPLCKCEQLFIGCAINGANCKTRGISICK